MKTIICFKLTSCIEKYYDQTVQVKYPSQDEDWPIHISFNALELLTYASLMFICCQISYIYYLPIIKASSTIYCQSTENVSATTLMIELLF